jgi:hypothetical protein
MFATRPPPLIVAAWLSLVASLVLAIMPFVVPSMPIGPVILANWVLFMLVGYWASPRPLRFLPPFQKMERANFRLWRLVFIAFVAAGWIAVFNARNVI